MQSVFPNSMSIFFIIKLNLNSSYNTKSKFNGVNKYFHYSLFEHESHTIHYLSYQLIVLSCDPFTYQKSLNAAFSFPTSSASRRSRLRGDFFGFKWVYSIQYSQSAIFTVHFTSTKHWFRNIRISIAYVHHPKTIFL